MKKNIFLLIALSAISFSIIDAAPLSIKNPPCQSEEACLNDNSCECYCSMKCGFRKKTKDDRPVYKHGVCWCKQWDLDSYEKRHCNTSNEPAPIAGTATKAANKNYSPNNANY